jgi:Mg/Co/Ni transporter MgtE
MHVCIWAKQKTKQLVHVSLKTTDTYGHLLLLKLTLGVLIPLSLRKFGRDPAIGSSVMITAVTDSGGFFIFLGLATVFLL